MDDEINKCQICCNSTAKYVCPRCNCFYCSLICYKSELHLKCSEAFYKDCVIAEMQLENNGPDSQKKMIEILSRFNVQQAKEEEESESLDSDDEADLHERLKDINLDNPDSLWKCLTESEKQEFEELVHNGNITSVVPVWEPWWNFRKKKVLIEELNSVSQSDSEKFISKCPKIKIDVPQLSQLLRQTPSPHVKWNIANVLSAYCYITQYFNGEHLLNSVEASEIMGNISGNLKSQQNYSSEEDSILSVSKNILTFPGSEVEVSDLTKNLMENVRQIFGGPDEKDPKFYIQSALSDIHNLFSSALKVQNDRKGKDGQFNQKFGGISTIGISKRNLKLYLKKIEYYIAWSQK